MLSSDKTTSNIPKCSTLARIIVSNSRTAHYLESKGLNNVKIIKPGIDLNLIHFNKSDVFDKNKPLKIIIASAPWTRNQIKSKGIINLLQLIKSENIELTLVLRGHFEKEIRELIRNFNAEESVQIINGKIDVPGLMKQHHVVVLLSEESAIVKSYPHSLVEGLSVGIPVVVSDTIAMADMVRENGLGEVVRGISSASLSNAMSSIRTYYHKYVESISKFDLGIFSPQNFVDNTIKIYEEVLSENK